MHVRIAAFALALAACLARAAVPGTEDTASRAWQRVTVEPMKTSIYLGSVRLIPSVFEQAGDTLVATYEARVMPFVFCNETGSVKIALPVSELRRIARGEVRPFSGEAVNDSGDKRRVEGRAEPADATHGKIKVRIFVSKRIELIFNGTYRFAGDDTPATAGGPAARADPTAPLPPAGPAGAAARRELSGDVAGSRE